jgi:hypothetical protein
MPANNPFFDHYLHLRSLPDSTLRDLGRNEAAPRDYRKFAVELLLNRRSPYAEHSDLQQFVTELEAEMDGIQTEFPAPEPVDPGPGPLTCSVTTKTMFGGDVVDMDALRKSMVDKTLDGLEGLPEPDFTEEQRTQLAQLVVDTSFTGFDSVQKVDEPKPERKPRKPKKDTDDT